MPDNMANRQDGSDTCATGQDVRGLFRSSLVSRNVTINGHRTSVRLEPDMWAGLNDICRRERTRLHAICSVIAKNKSDNTSLTAAIRVFIMDYYRAAATEEGHVKAGHGAGGMAIQNGVVYAVAKPPLAMAPEVKKPPQPYFMMGMSRNQATG